MQRISSRMTIDAPLSSATPGEIARAEQWSKDAHDRAKNAIDVYNAYAARAGNPTVDRNIVDELPQYIWRSWKEVGYGADRWLPGAKQVYTSIMTRIAQMMGGDKP